MAFILKKAIVIFISVFFVTCLAQGESKPSKNELKNALVPNLPRHVELNEFSIEAILNVGNIVEPDYRSRFNATVKSIVNLYKKGPTPYSIDTTKYGVAFVYLSAAKGDKIKIFGRTQSILYQGSWRHKITIDGNPVIKMGIPLNQFSDNRVIVLGSDEERELRKNLANAEKILIGTWRDNNSLITYKPDGTYHTKFDDGDECIQTWTVERYWFYSKILKYKRKGENWEEFEKSRYTGTFIYIDQNNYIIIAGGKKWSAKRIK